MALKKPLQAPLVWWILKKSFLNFLWHRFPSCNISRAALVFCKGTCHIYLLVLFSSEGLTTACPNEAPVATSSNKVICNMYIWIIFLRDSYLIWSFFGSFNTFGSWHKIYSRQNVDFTITRRQCVEVMLICLTTCPSDYNFHRLAQGYSANAQLGSTRLQLCFP